MDLDFGCRKKDFILIVVAWVMVGFVIGWLFPVEGPYDEKYEQQVVQHKKRSSTVNVAAPKKKKIVLVDLNEDDIEEMYYLIPFEKFGGDE